MSRTSGPLKVSKRSLQDPLRREAQWITWARACVVGCSEPTLERLIRSGRIRTRTVPRGIPSLDVRSVEGGCEELAGGSTRR